MVCFNAGVCFARGFGLAFVTLMVIRLVILCTWFMYVLC